jgi:glycosyltransferase involved in cell wall biosynthesis
VGAFQVSKKSILIMFHCAENTGYAIASLEWVFLNAAKRAGFAENRIFWSYSRTITKDNSHILECNYGNKSSHENLKLCIAENNIDTVLAFDLGFPSPVISALRSAGIKFIISYWGASMSSINFDIKLMLKRLEFLLTKNKPDKFIFESEAMRKTATHGRGVKASATEVIYLGVDDVRFSPEYNQQSYTYDTFNIPKNRKIVFYSGHMEERKGVRVIVQAAIRLLDELDYSDVHFVICGNKNNEADVYENLLVGKKARAHVTFAGYRTDIPDLMRGSHIGTIASTGWDSFTMSSVEMMASGLPLIVSNLQGLSETIEDGKNGFLIPPGDHTALADCIRMLAESADLANAFSIASRQRAEKLFSFETQVNAFAALFRRSV